MKKFLVALLAISMLVVLAACNDNTDPGVQKADDPEAPITEKALEDKQELATELGIDINVSDKYSPSRYSIIEGDQAQVEFSVGDSMAYGRVAIGVHDNMSGYASSFDFDEQVDISGLSGRVRYPDPDAEVTNLTGRIGIADAVDEANGITYLVVIFTNPTKAQLVEVMEDLIANSKLVDTQLPADAGADDTPAAE